MKELTSHFFPPKALQLQKRYLRRGLYKHQDTKIRYYICCIDKMVYNLEKLPPFGAGKRLPDDTILKLVEFSLPKKWQNNFSSKCLTLPPKASRRLLISASA